MNLAREVFGDRLDLAERYAALLSGPGIERGLIGPRESDRIWDRHLLNSAALFGLIGEGASVADVGSGAGLPGVVLAIGRPDLQVTLIEPLLRRSTFLDEVVDELGLGDQVTVVRSRAEDLTTHFDVVTARAVAPLDRLLTWTVPLWRPGGQLIALKGSSAEDEIRAAGPQLQRLGVTARIREVRAAPSAQATRAVVVS